MFIQAIRKVRFVQVAFGVLVGAAIVLVGQCFGETKAALQIRQFADTIVSLTMDTGLLYDDPHVSRERTPGGDILLSSETRYTFVDTHAERDRLARIVRISDDHLKNDLNVTVEVIANTTQTTSPLEINNVSDISSRFPEHRTVTTNDVKTGDYIIITWKMVVSPCKLIESPVSRKW